MQDDKYIQIAFNRQLVSVMNRTKWRELVDILDSNPAFTPKTRIKYLDSFRMPVEFGYLDSHVIKFGGFTRAIEWLEIDPIKRERIGWLIKPQETDYSDWIRGALANYAIPFDEIDGLFRINGYLRTA